MSAHAQLGLGAIFAEITNDRITQRIRDLEKMFRMFLGSLMPFYINKI